MIFYRGIVLAIFATAAAATAAGSAEEAALHGRPHNYKRDTTTSSPSSTSSSSRSSSSTSSTTTTTGGAAGGNNIALFPGVDVNGGRGSSTTSSGSSSSTSSASSTSSTSSSRSSSSSSSRSSTSTSSSRSSSSSSSSSSSRSSSSSSSSSSSRTSSSTSSTSSSNARKSGSSSWSISSSSGMPRGTGGNARPTNGFALPTNRVVRLGTGEPGMNIPTRSSSSSSRSSTSHSSTSTGLPGGTMPKQDAFPVAEDKHRTFNASFTAYGSQTGDGETTCSSLKTACGFYTKPGYAASASKNIFGARKGSDDWSDTLCGGCFILVPEHDVMGDEQVFGDAIVVKVTDMCPDTKPQCKIETLEDTNEWGANVNFDLCSDSGAANRLFGSSGVNKALGKAVEVDCDAWMGKERGSPAAR